MNGILVIPPDLADVLKYFPMQEKHARAAMNVFRENALLKAARGAGAKSKKKMTCRKNS